LSLLEEQYRDDSNLRARIDLHARFSTSPQGWFDWLWEREAPPPGARVLEVGCGPAEMWKATLDRLDASVSLTLSDFSPGMIEAARKVVGERASYAVADVQDLPFADAEFDVLIANHMLYHVPDRPQAFREFARVLAPDGVLRASTNGHGHMRELQALAPDWEFSRHTEEFGLETGPEQLAPYFTELRVERFADCLEITEVEPVLAYIRSSSSYRGQELAAARATVEAALARDGVFRVHKEHGVISGRKP
jgi:ubiquinone/menaquinone biosynthesis C-methylase UbiE